MSDAAPISRFPVPSLDTLPADIRDRIRAVAERTGFVPNVFLALAHRPDEWRAFVANLQNPQWMMPKSIY